MNDVKDKDASFRQRLIADYDRLIQEYEAGITTAGEYFGMWLEPSDGRLILAALRTARNEALARRSSPASEQGAGTFAETRIAELVEHGVTALTKLGNLNGPIAECAFIADWTGEARDTLRALVLAPAPVDGGQPTHRHKKRGTEYVLIGFGKMQAERWRELRDPPPAIMLPVDMREVAIYRSVDDGSLWVRPREEFEDGRFGVVGSPAPVSDGGK